MRSQGARLVVVCVALVAVCVSSAPHKLATRAKRDARADSVSFLEQGATVGMPAQCKGLEAVHGASMLNNFLTTTAQVLPNKTVTDLCVSATDCKRLLRPLITVDGQYRKKCPNDCSGNGVCRGGGLCGCNPGFEGVDCSRMRCPGNCTGNGRCSNGQCFCNPGFEGTSCEKTVDCPRGLGAKQCSGHGKCFYGKCFCDPGYTNEDCSEVSQCPNDCGTSGGTPNLCLHGQCFCAPGLGGEDCLTSLAASRCLNDCNGKGECIGGKCHCAPGRFGKDCNKTKACPRGFDDLQCSGHGHCESGQCQCDLGWAGFSCALQLPCPGNGTCSGHGVCHPQTRQCFCHPGHSGDACDRVEPCINGCSNHGVCVNKKCHCLTGFYGEDCSKGQGSKSGAQPGQTVPGQTAVITPKPRPAPKKCALTAVLVEELRRGSQGCPNGCSGVGSCLNGTCACLAGFAGEDCGTEVLKMPCPNDCSNRGACIFGKCHCLPQYKGLDCSENNFASPDPKKCPKACSGAGQCVWKGEVPACSCDPGFAGAACDQEVPCKNNCHGRGSCGRGKCFCFPGFSGGACEKHASCPEGCNNKGLCFYGKCFCQTGYGGSDCSKPVQCTKGCHLEHGVCTGNDNCACNPGFTGVDCSKRLQCPNDCTSPKHGHCTATQFGVKCLCRSEWTGDDCSKNVHDCPSKCSGRGTCIGGTCHCKSGYAGPGCEKKAGGGGLFDVLNGGMGDTDNTGGKGGTKQPPASNQASAPAAESPSFTPSPTKSSPQTGAHSGPVGGAPSKSDLARFRAVASEGTQAAVKRMNAASVASSLRFRAVAGTSAGNCPNACSKHGICANGVCFCDPGFEADDCGKAIQCPKDCSGKGICQYGMCYCDPTYTGDACHLKATAATPFSQTWITVIIASLTFVIGLIVGRKTVAQAGLRFADKISGKHQALTAPA